MLTLILMSTVMIGITQAQDQQLTEADNGKTFHLSIGSALTIDLPVTSGTGYSWDIQTNNNQLLRPVNESGQKSIGPTRPGGPTNKRFRFKALNSGGEALKLIYHRPWEKNVAPAKTFSIMVTIDRNGKSTITTLENKDNNSNVTIKKGGLLLLKLKSNPSTGYSWQVVKKNNWVLPLQSSKQERDPNTPTIPGAPSFQIFQFKGSSSGNALIELEYKRSWEKNTPPAETFKANVTVK